MIGAGDEELTGLMTDYSMNNLKAKPQNLAERVRRRGSIYAVVMAMAILVSLIGLSAVAVGRINLRTASAGGDAAAAEVLAVSAIEHATAVLNTEAGWRANVAYAGGLETTPIALGGGANFAWQLNDELDGNIALDSGGIQPVRVSGIGRAGDARRKYSVVFVPTGTNLLTNPGMEAGVLPYEAAGTCTVVTTSTGVRNGLRSLWVQNRASAAAGATQDVTAKITNGKWYYIEAWVKMGLTPQEPVISLVVLSAGNPDVVLLKPMPQAAQTAGLGWTKIGYSIKANLPTTFDTIQWKIHTATTTQDFWVDDVKLIEATGSTVPMPMAAARETWKQLGMN